MKHAFASHLAGRMLPGLFTYLGVGKKERFPGDPWPHLNSAPAWYWMHSTGCSAGLYRSRPVARQAFPADLDALFVSMPAARPNQPRAAAIQPALFPETRA
jgi:hypothetical protein